jgi:hypothetical protein
VFPCGAVLETFAADPGWTSVGLPDGGSDFRWSATAYAGGDMGEIGGTLQRSGAMQSYADTTLAISTGDCVAASGVLVAPNEDDDYNSVIHFGHFSTTGGPLIGFSFAESDNATLRVYLEAGAVSQQVFVMDQIDMPRMWSYEYDPASGMMTLGMDGLGTEAIAVTPDDVAGMDAIDAFGLLKLPHDTPEQYPGLLRMYVDEIAYTR